MLADFLNEVVTTVPKAQDKKNLNKKVMQPRIDINVEILDNPYDEFLPHIELSEDIKLSIQSTFELMPQKFDKLIEFHLY